MKPKNNNDTFSGRKSLKFFLFFLLLGVSFFGFNFLFGQEFPIFHGCAISPRHYMWVCEKESSYVFASWNGGLVWENLGKPVNTYRWLYDIFFLNDTLGWVAAEGGFIFYTPDGGLSWQTQSQGGSKFAQRVFMLNKNYGWVACGEAIVLKTTDGGEYWEQIILPNPPFPVDTVDFYGISFIDSLKGWVCAGRYPQGDTFIKGQGYIAKTTNGGDTWTLLLKDSIYDFFDCHFISENEGWVVGGNDQTLEPCILHTTDGGFSWKRQSVPSGNYLRACHFIGRKGWVSGMLGTILHTTDGGQNWVAQANPATQTLFDIEFIDSLSGIASGTGVVLYTKDGGRNWLIANVGIKEDQRPCPFTPFNAKRRINPRKMKIFDALGRRCTTVKKGVYFIEDKKSIKKLVILR